MRPASLLIPVFALSLWAAETRQTTLRRPSPQPYEAPDLKTLLTASDDLSGPIERYEADAGNLRRFYVVPGSSIREHVFHQFYQAWLRALDKLDFDRLGPEARIDYVLFRNTLQHEQRALDAEHRRWEEVQELLPFAGTVRDLLEKHQQLVPMDAAAAASTLVAIGRQVDDLSRKLGEQSRPAGVKRTVANRAASNVSHLRQALQQWFDFYNAYDPVFTWWAAAPFRNLDKNLETYGTRVKEKLADVRSGDRDTIIGDPIGREALMDELAFEMVPYTPEQLLAIANQEFAWCEAEMKKASRELGYGDDWRKALEHVKNLYVPPGEQTKLILEQALEAIDYVEQNNLVTVPPLARDTWRMIMMTPERQRINPFFTGGETISVSYPTDGMSHEQKLMSMRGNNIHFSRATVFHELIPGHHLQGFMNARYRPYRHVFRTPFWGEGWSLHWEMLFWDMGFQKTPENKIGMLFWRSHRAARIVFSLSFHLEKMTAQEAVNYLVERVGHERENAAAEVRRSFEGRDGPLYQSAYLLGALQIRALHKELVGSGKMTNKAFHDAILQGGSRPIETVRASLTGRLIPKDFKPSWQFYGDVQPVKETK